MSTIKVWFLTHGGARAFQEALLKMKLEPEPDEIKLRNWGGEGYGIYHGKSRGMVEISYSLTSATNKYQKDKQLISIWDEIKHIISKDENPEMETGS